MTIIVILIANFRLLFAFFLWDDFLLLYQISNWPFLDFIFSNFGGHLFIFRNLVYYGMHTIFGANAAPYLLTVLLTHLGAAYILFKIILLIVEKPSLAAAGTMIWGICPVNYATLLWYAAFAQILVGFFFLLIVYDLLKIEKGLIAFSAKRAVLWSFYLFLMSASYGSGLAIACLAPFAIVIILWNDEKKWRISASVLPVIALILLLFVYKDSIYGYVSGEVQDTRPITLIFAIGYYQSILEFFIRMFMYAIYCMAAFPLLFFSSAMNSTNDMIIMSIPVIVVLVLYIVLFARAEGRRFRFYTVLGIFFLVLVGLTAYGRAPIYVVFNSPISSAALTPRYYYVLLIVTILILVSMADELFRILPKLSKALIPLVFILIAASLYPGIILGDTIDPLIKDTKQHEKSLYYNTLNDIETFIRSHPIGSTVFIDNRMNDKFHFLDNNDMTFPGKAAVFSNQTL